MASLLCSDILGRKTIVLKGVEMRLNFGSAIFICAILLVGVSFGADRCDFSAYNPRQFAPEEKFINQSIITDYPSKAMKHGIQGLVEVKVLFDDNGTVQKACAVSGHQLLRGPAESAALKTRFDPVLINAVPAPYVERQISFIFVLPKPTNKVEATQVEYCELQGNEKYDEKIVRVHGIYFTDFEESTLDSPNCTLPDIRFNTLRIWIRFDPSYNRLTDKRWQRAMEKVEWRHPVEVVFVGRYKHRTSGHMDMYSSRLEVMMVEYVGSPARAAKLMNR
jgi:hypothetical protein